MWRLIAAASLALRCSPGSLHPPPKPTSLLEAERGVWRLGKELLVELAWSESPLLGKGGGCNGEREQHLMALEQGIVTAKIRL